MFLPTSLLLVLLQVTWRCGPGLLVGAQTTDVTSCAVSEPWVRRDLRPPLCIVSLTGVAGVQPRFPEFMPDARVRGSPVLWWNYPKYRNFTRACHRPCTKIRPPLK